MGEGGKCWGGGKNFFGGGGCGGGGGLAFLCEARISGFGFLQDVLSGSVFLVDSASMRVGEALEYKHFSDFGFLFFPIRRKSI